MTLTLLPSRITHHRQARVVKIDVVKLSAKSTRWYQLNRRLRRVSSLFTRQLLLSYIMMYEAGVVVPFSGECSIKLGARQSHHYDVM